jgi:NAD(P)-dependent dehydrogenase (short-subunit alcohol dehydrogenase family)
MTGMLLDGQVAIVTGAGTGIGAATALVLAREGAAVVLTGRRRAKLDEVADEIRRHGGQATVAPGDVGQEATCEAAVAAAAAHGRVDILVNNAGVHAHAATLHDITTDEWERFLRVNLSGPFFMMRGAIPHMLEGGGGAICNVSSIFGLVALKNAASYGAAKGGLVHLTRSAAIDYADRNIRVNCVCPDLVEPVERAETPPEERALLAEGWLGSPTGRGTTTDELAEMILFLVGPHSANITGTIIPVDGGYSAR